MVLILTSKAHMGQHLVMLVHRDILRRLRYYETLKEKNNIILTKGWRGTRRTAVLSAVILGDGPSLPT
jgi:hypothetical protein